MVSLLGCAMRVVIVGGGVIGLLTAVSCVMAGHRVLVLDQSGIPFTGAASFDRHRALRALHLDDLPLTAAAVRAHRRWTDLERLLATRFYEQVGALTVLSPGDLPRAHDMLTSAGSQPRVITAPELAASYPHIRFPAGAGAVVESRAGILLADRLLMACADWLRQHDSASLRPHSAVVSIDAGSPAVQLANGDSVRGDAVLVATGPWSRALLPPELAGRLVLYRQSMIYLHVPSPDLAAWLATPSVRPIGPDKDTWMIPPVGGTPLKVSAASACRVADEVTGNATPPFWRDHLIGVAAAIVPAFDASWLAGTRDCYYLSQPPASPMLAVLADRVISFAACAGASFKFAPLIAAALAERLAGGRPAPTGLRFIDDPIAVVPGGTAAVRPLTRPAMRGAP
jgi:sarcosine oxidase